ncbi:hypothetical protein B484DRAFT_162516 [Ochromonadaceae sp. CCMP2298]|nr:hypothetical protein B484DRAFT_162516 [Ochromonadaceae sp. CCMP2298]
MSPIKMPTGSISIGSALKKTAEDTPTAPMLPMALMGQRKPSFNSSFFGSSRQPAFEPICEDSFMRVDSFMRKDSFQSDSVADEPDTPQSGGMQVWTPTPQLSGAYASPQPSPAKVHSAKVHMRSVRMAPELFAPPEQVSSKSTIGFEDSDKIDYMDGEHENEHEDEDIRFMEELETARQEMLVQLHREQAAQAKVDVAEGECAVLSNQIGVLVSRLEEMELKMAELKSRCKEMNSERGSADRELEQKEHENQLLREIVHEDYRYHTAAMERALSAQEDAERSRHTPVQRSDQGTQIACSVCAIRAGDAPYVDHDHDGYDEDTVAMANETLGRALQGVVLVAQPRHINAATKRELLSRLQSSMQQDPRERERDREKERAWEREQRERELREQEQREREQKLKRRHKNRHADGNSSPVEGKLGKRTKLGIGGDEPRGERKERVFTQQDIFNHIENAQHQLLDYRDPVRTKVLSSEQEQSKFSKLKKMPQKVQLSASTGPIYFNTRAPSPEKMPSSALPPSAQLKLPRPQSAQSALRRSSQRTASHTAAYFQNQHMGDEHVLPLFMPVSSEHGPLSSLAYASRLAHQSSPHVVLAEPQKRALSANAAQRQRLQVEVPLAMATVRMEESQDSPMSPSSAEPADLANKHMLGHTLDFSGKESVEICTYEKYALRS